MFSLVQEEKPSTICQQAQSLCRAYSHLQSAYCELAQTEGLWNPEVDEYLHEELYLDRTARQFMEEIVEALEPMQKPLQQLALDHNSLCSDLLRVGRGESFSV